MISDIWIDNVVVRDLSGGGSNPVVGERIEAEDYAAQSGMHQDVYYAVQNGTHQAGMLPCLHCRYGRQAFPFSTERKIAGHLGNCYL